MKKCLFPLDAFVVYVQLEQKISNGFHLKYQDNEKWRVFLAYPSLSICRAVLIRKLIAPVTNFFVCS